MDIALTENATVYAATRGNTAKRWTVHIRLARATVSVPRARASARKAGKVPTAVKWTKRRSNACQTAAVMEISISRPRPASANRCGPAMIVQKVKGLMDIIFCDRKYLYKKFNKDSLDISFFVSIAEKFSTRKNIIENEYCN